LERAGLGLVRVAAEVLVHRTLRDEAGLLTHREAGAAAAAQPRAFELLEKLVLRQVDQALLQARVAAQPLVHVDRGEPGLVDVLEEDALLLSHPRAPFRAAAALRASTPRRSA